MIEKDLKSSLRNCGWSDDLIETFAGSEPVRSIGVIGVKAFDQSSGFVDKSELIITSTIPYEITTTYKPD
ncbi:hypothetical protein [Candidatus Thiodiazotropha sp. LNASS1]|uniref:hypothetical protein n=1 Tax=Candidatus Thiodiazotropha sp. LNASS1 TaxID=3096260 RepID=UPI0034DE6C32